MADVEKFLGSRDFGGGILIGSDDQILDLSPKQRLLVSAWRHACPRPIAVSTEFGLEWTKQRYDSCNYVYKSIICEEARVKPKLYTLLITPVKRSSTEPAGVYENGRVPKSYQREMSPLSTPWGYALPRVYIVGAVRNENRTWEGENKALYLLQLSIGGSANPVDLLAYFSEAVVNFGANPTEVLSHVFAPGILREQNCHTLFREIADSLRNNAPRLWKCYRSISPNKRKAAGILNFPY